MADVRAEVAFTVKVHDQGTSKPAAGDADGQFARSALTMAELEDVKRALTEVLIHRLHARAAYPGQDNAGAQAKRQGA